MTSDLRITNPGVESGNDAEVGGSGGEERARREDLHVAALYVDPRGPYPALLGPEFCWDATRDARDYWGPWPVVAHPPCGPWSSLRHLYRGGEQDCGPRAVEQVRTFGGVLEQPAGSKLWEFCRLPKPVEGDWVPKRHDWYVDQLAGWSVEIDQVSWGHPARKRTWLFFVGVTSTLAWVGRRTGGTPTHWCSGGRSPANKGVRGTVPPGIKVCSAQQRRRTPVAFAEWLISLARSAAIARSPHDQQGA